MILGIEQFSSRFFEVKKNEIYKFIQQQSRELKLDDPILLCWINYSIIDLLTFC